MQELIKTFITMGLQISLVIFLAVLSIKITEKFIDRIIKNITKSRKESAHSEIEFEKRMNTTCSILKSVVNFVLIITASMIILEKLGINIAPILAAAGVAGIAVGFGSQRLVEDIISGFIILISDQLRVGDVVKIADKTGTVEKIDLKMVVLRDIAGNAHFIRNGKIDSITNMTKDYSCYVFSVGASVNHNIEKIFSTIQSAGADLKKHPDFSDLLIGEVEIFGVDKFDEKSMTIKARLKTKPQKQWIVGRELNKILKLKFESLNQVADISERGAFFIQNESSQEH